MEFFSFLFRYSLILTGLYLVWSIPGKKRSIPAFDRFYILFTPVLAGIISMIRIPLSFDSQAMIYLQDIPEIQSAMSFVSGDHLTGSFSGGGQSPVYEAAILILATSGILIFIKLIFSLFIKIRLIKKYGITKIGLIKVVSVDKKILPFSFINFVFLNTASYDPISLQAILEHEKTHVRQLHFVDLIVFEILKIFLWFHPVYWLMRKNLIETHEFLADRFVLDSGISRLDYMKLIARHLNFHPPVGFGSTFSKKITIKRLQMMKNQKHTKIFPRIILSIISIGIVALLAGFQFPGPQTGPGLKPGKIEMKSPPVPSISPVDLEKVTFTSHFGMRMHPVKKVKKMHNGIDLAAPEGTDVFATADGTVIETGFKPDGAGKYILISHGDEYETFYSQLSQILIKKDQKVKTGEIIGYVGSSGLSTGPHLHYEVRKSGKPVDPLDYMPGSASVSAGK